jgi:hypothetical protein
LLSSLSASSSSLTSSTDQINALRRACALAYYAKCAAMAEHARLIALRTNEEFPERIRCFLNEQVLTRMPYHAIVKFTSLFCSAPRAHVRVLLVSCVPTGEGVRVPAEHARLISCTFISRLLNVCVHAGCDRRSA